LLKHVAASHTLLSHFFAAAALLISSILRFLVKFPGTVTIGRSSSSRRAHACDVSSVAVGVLRNISDNTAACAPSLAALPPATLAQGPRSLLHTSWRGLLWGGALPCPHVLVRLIGGAARGLAAGAPFLLAEPKLLTNFGDGGFPLLLQPPLPLLPFTLLLTAEALLLRPHTQPGGGQRRRSRGCTRAIATHAITAPGRGCGWR